MVKKQFLFWGACVAGLLAYRYGYRTFPDGAPVMLKVMLGVMHCFSDLTEIASFLGMGDSLVLKAELFAAIPMNLPVPDGVTTTDTTFDGVPVRIYLPDGVKNSPGIVYFHGGGWMFGSVEWTNQFCGEMAWNMNVVIVSVEYRKAPGHPFPVPFEDCEKATVHLLRQGEEYGVDPTRVAVMGDSSGANLAAAVALKLRDDEILPILKGQVLLYPPLQALDFSTPSYQGGEKTEAMLRVTDMVSFWLYYGQGHIKNLKAALKNEHVSSEIRTNMAASFLNHDNIDKALNLKSQTYVRPEIPAGDVTVWREIKDVFLNPYFSPLLAANLTGLPAAFVVACEFDPLRDDGLLYAGRLKESGVAVDLQYSAIAHHGFLSVPFDTFESLKIKVALSKYIKNIFDL